MSALIGRKAGTNLETGLWLPGHMRAGDMVFSDEEITGDFLR